MSLNTLKETYKACCQSYADLMIKLMGQTWTNSYWVANIYGGTLDIAGEYYFDMSDIVYAIDNEMTPEDIKEWYRYNISASSVDVFNIKISEWNSGANRVSREDIELLSELKSEVTNAIMTEGVLSPNYSNACAKINMARDRILKSIGVYSSSINDK